MARPYSQDLRDRVVGSVASGRSCRATAALFGVSVCWSPLSETAGTKEPGSSRRSASLRPITQQFVMRDRRGTRVLRQRFAAASHREAALRRAPASHGETGSALPEPKVRGLTAGGRWIRTFSTRAPAMSTSHGFAAASHCERAPPRPANGGFHATYDVLLNSSARDAAAEARVGST